MSTHRLPAPHGTSYRPIASPALPTLSAPPMHRVSLQLLQLQRSLGNRRLAQCIHQNQQAAAQETLAPTPFRLARKPADPPPASEKVQDPRVTALITDTNHELAEERLDYGVLMTPGSAGGGPAVNKHMVDDYKDQRSELADYLALAPTLQSGKDDSLLKQWSQVLYLAGDSRRTLASNIIVHYEGAITAEKEHRKGLIAHMAAQNKSLHTYLTRAAKIKKLGDTIAVVQHVGDALEALEAAEGNIAHFLEEEVPRIGWKVGAAIAGRLGEEVFIILHKSKVVESSVEVIQDLATQDAINSEGYASLEALAGAMQQSKENILDSETLLSYQAHQKEVAESLYAQKASGTAAK